MPLQEYSVVRTERAAPDNLIKFPGRKLIPGINDLTTKFPDVAALWDMSRNGDLTPDQLLPGSNKKVWWQCEKGHSWEASPYSLTNMGSRCPYCAGKRVIPGETDLATRYPEVAVLWDCDNNGNADPTKIMPATKQKFWWRCEKGHSWEAAVYSLTIAKSGCPYCSGRSVIPGETDLLTQCPEIAELWDRSRNEDLEPSEVSPGSHRKVWWKCTCGHSWEARVYSVAIDGRRCPRCARSGRPKKHSHEASLV